MVFYLNNEYILFHKSQNNIQILRILRFVSSFGNIKIVIIKEGCLEGLTLKLVSIFYSFGIGPLAISQRDQGLFHPLGTQKLLILGSDALMALHLK